MTDAMRYRVVFEGNDEIGYSAYLSYLPGCVATGETFEETKELTAEAVEASPGTHGGRESTDSRTHSRNSRLSA